MLATVGLPSLAEATDGHVVSGEALFTRSKSNSVPHLSASRTALSRRLLEERERLVARLIEVERQIVEEEEEKEQLS